MLRHYVIFSYEEGFFQNEHFVEYCKAFEEIKNAYPSILNVSVQRNMVDRETNMDLMVIMDLKNVDALIDYLDHPVHHYMCNKYNPHVTKRVSFDYYIN